MKQSKGVPKPPRDNIKIPANAAHYRLFAMNWLRYEHGCYAISFERTPVAHSSRPDVLGLTPTKMLIEIEIKVSKADLDRDASKEHRKKIASDISRVVPETANYVYYMVPESLVAYACSIDLAVNSAGIISLNHAYRHKHSRLPTLAVHRRAHPLHSAKLSDASVNKMIAQQCGTMCSIGNELLFAYNNVNLDFFNFSVKASDIAPKQASITPIEAIFDDDTTKRTGRIVHGHELVSDAQWSDKSFRPSLIKLHKEDHIEVIKHADN